MRRDRSFPRGRVSPGMQAVRRTCILAFALLCCMVLPGQAASSEPIPDEAAAFQEQYDALLHESGADALFSQLPEDGQKLLEENGVDGVDQESLMGLSFWDVLGGIWSGVKSAAARPLTMLATSIGVILLCALLNSMKSSFQNPSFERIFSVMSVISLASVVILPIAQMITKTAALLKEMSGFMLGFVPVYVGIVSVSGKPVSAMTYNACVVGVAQIISRIASTVLVPLLAIYMALCLIGAASQEIGMEGISKAVKKVVTVALTFFLTVFVGLLSVQGTIAASADTVTLKTAKFAVSTFLPVVGGAIGDALNSIQGCVGVIRSTVGGFGIVAIAAAFLPSVITLLLMQLSLTIAGAVGEALGVDRVSSLMRTASSVLSLLLGILLVFAVIFIVSISLMLSLSASG